MPWHGHLAVSYRRTPDRTAVYDRHGGPLRVLQSLYPEGDGVCHSVLVHPPGGIVGGDVLRIAATLSANAHALVTTPGATRFYRSANEPTVQRWQRTSPTARGSNGCRRRRSATARRWPPAT